MSFTQDKLKMFAGGIILNMVAGNLNNWGTYLTYVASYYYQYDPSITVSDFSIVPFYGYIAESLTTLFISYKADSIPIHIILCTFSLFFSVIMFFSSFITNPHLFNIVFGFSLGSLSSSIFLPSLWMLWNLIPDNKSVTSGILLTGYSLGPIPFSIMFSMLANPLDIKANRQDAIGNNIFDETVAGNVPFTLRIFSLCLIVCIVIGILLIPMKNHKTDAANLNEREKNLTGLLKNFRFWNLFLMMTLAYSCLGYAQTLYKVIAINFINDDYFSTYVGMVSLFTNGIGRFTFGYLINRFYWKKVMSLVYLIEFSIMMGLWYSLSEKMLYAFFIILYNFTMASLYNNVLILTENEFPGDKKVISYICLSFMISLFIPYFMDKVITPIIGYFFTFAIIAGFSLILLVQTIFYEEKLPRKCQ